MITDPTTANRRLYEQYYRIGYGHAIAGEGHVCLPLNKAGANGYHDGYSAGLAQQELDEQAEAYALHHAGALANSEYADHHQELTLHVHPASQ